jgi:hypothetical protein
LRLRCEDADRKLSRMRSVCAISLCAIFPVRKERLPDARILRRPLVHQPGRPQPARSMRRIIRKIIPGAVLLALAIAAVLVAIGIVSYWTIQAASFRVEGDSLISYDPEIGFVPRPNAVTRRTDIDPQGMVVVSYRVFNDRRGARVTRLGEQAAAHPDILFIGGSDTWGHGVENEETFAYRVPRELGATGANLAMGSYGTTQSLQMLRRNRELAPKLIVYPFSADHLLRNVLPCARSYYPFCLDISHVVWDESGRPKIAPPWSDGATRTILQAKADIGWLDPLTWVIHGTDVAYGRALLTLAKNAAANPAAPDQALEYLLIEMAETAKSIRSNLLIVYVPQSANDSKPDVIFGLTAKLHLRILDLSPAFQMHQSPSRPPLYIPNDDYHPSAAGHALIADEIVAFVRQEGLLGSDRSNAGTHRPGG